MTNEKLEQCLAQALEKKPPMAWAAVSPPWESGKERKFPWKKNLNP